MLYFLMQLDVFDNTVGVNSVRQTTCVMLLGNRLGSSLFFCQLLICATHTFFEHSSLILYQCCEITCAITQSLAIMNVTPANLI